MALSVRDLLKSRNGNGHAPASLPIDRKYGLLHLLVQARYLLRNDIEKLADQLRSEQVRNTEAKEGFKTWRSLTQLAMSADLRFAKDIHNDGLWTNATLLYDLTELTRSEDGGLPPSDGPWESFVDLLAGEPPERSLLKDLYSLESSGLLLSARTTQEENEHGEMVERFVPSNAGIDHTNIVKISLRYYHWNPEKILLIGRSPMDLTYGNRAKD